MSASFTDQRLLTDLDFARLIRLSDDLSDDDLADALAEVDQVPPREVPGDVVTMYSQVEIQHLHTGLRQTLAICYPRDAEPDRGFVSVLSRVGLGLLGRRVGSIASWVTPSGVECEARIEAILFQPEASGDYTT